MDVAAPVDVRGLSEEAGGDLRRRGVVRVGLAQHFLLNCLAQLDAGQRGLLDALLLLGLRDVLRHSLGATVLVHSHEDHQAVAGAGELAVARVGREHFVDDVHGGTPGVGDAGTHLDQVAGRNWAGEVDMPHIGGHAIGLRPAHGAGIGRLIDPLQHAPTVHAHAAGVQHVGGGGEET